MAVAVLALVNAALYAAQVYVNFTMSRNIGPMSRKHETLITPAPYAFAIWGIIYTLLSVLVIVDVFFPSVSVFASAPHPNLLRLLFSITCIANATWIGLFSNEFIHLSTLVISLLWLTLFTLYVYIRLESKAQDFSLARYICSELGLTVYFAWTCAATLISFAVSLQDFFQGYLSLATYVVLLSVLGVATISAVVFNEDLAFGVVAVWALVAVAVKNFPWGSPAIERMHASIKVCAAQNAAMVSAFIFITIAIRLISHFSSSANYELLDRAQPIMNGKTNNHAQYGTSD